MRNFVRGVIAALVVGASGLVAHAADLPSYKSPPPPAFIDPPFHPFQVRLKVAGVIPTNGHGTVYDEGIFHPLIGFVGPAGGLSSGPGGVISGSTNTSKSIIPMLDVAYYFTRNWAVEAICCVSAHHIQGTGGIKSEFAHTWVFPPSLLLQYHFTNFGAFQPYLGVGVNFTAYWGTRVNSGQSWPLLFAPGSALAGAVGVGSAFYSASVTPSWGVVGQGGFDYMFNDHWGVNIDAKYIMMEPTVHAHIVSFAPSAPALGPIFVPVRVHLPINPIVISAGLTYRFGGDWNVPKLLPF